MKVYTITGWRKKRTILLILLILLIAAIVFYNVFWLDEASETMTDDQIDNLQEDVLTQPIRVQALPDTTTGQIGS
jgi:hypothetical protein